jgi:L-threonylcarbamoyladenylate synthase
VKTLKTAQTPNQEIIKTTVEVLNQGGLVIFPTETTYGAGVDATNPEAVQKLLSYKSRREGKPLSIAVSDIDMAAQFVKINQTAQNFYEKFLPGPYTIVSKSLGKVAPGVESEFGTLGVRIPDYDLILQLSQEFGKPITATSANASGKKRPYTIQDILDNLSDKQKSLIDLVIDAGELPKNEPSMVIDTTLSTPVALRKRKSASSTKSAQNAETAKINAQSSWELTSNSEAETQDIARRLLLKNWEIIKKTGLIIALDGELGVGKTIFTKGAAKFLNIDETISSPTYGYVEEYDFKRHNVEGKLLHWDVWKVESQDELERLEFFEQLGPKKVIIVEWWDQIESMMDQEKWQNWPILKVKITQPKTEKPEQRTLQIAELIDPQQNHEE